MKDFFNGCTSLQELKMVYRQLAKKYHPDLGGDTETMKEINRQYELAFERMKYGSIHDENGTYTRQEKSSDFIVIIDILSRIENITVELCGEWLWISGKGTYAAKEILKKSGCMWSSKKKMWYWKPLESMPFINTKNVPMEKIRNKYGSRIICGGHENDSCMVRK